jgi:diaminopimelate decarboxylase
VDLAGLLADAGLRRTPEGRLELEQVDLEELARAVGTPAYVYNADAIRRRYLALDRAFGSLPHRIHYAVKANGNLAILGLFRQLGAGADIVSAGEMARVFKAGFAPEQVVFSGVGKTRQELAAAAAAGLGSINVESLDELDQLGGIAESLGRAVRVGIRFNPDVTADTHPYISTGGSGIKFGVPADQVREAITILTARPRLELVTVAIHIGSQILDVHTYQEGVARLLSLLDQVRGLGVPTVRSLDIGGGLGIRYAGEDPPSAQDFAEAIIPLVQGSGLALHLEPGRFLVGSAGLLLTRVAYRKLSGGKIFVVVDAGMTELVRPSRYEAYHHIVEVMRCPGELVPSDVVGPVCETGDFLALDRPLPPVQPGDLLAVLGAGAYGSVMGSTYNGRPRPPEVLVAGNTFRIVRRRETLEDLYSGESLQ